MNDFICYNRQELIDAFVESRYMMFIKYAAVQLQQLGLRKQMDIFKDGTKPEAAATAAALEASKKPDNADENKNKDDSNKEEEDKETGGSTKAKMEEEEAKKIVESITDSITSGGKKDIEDSTR